MDGLLDSSVVVHGLCWELQLDRMRQMSISTKLMCLVATWKPELRRRSFDLLQSPSPPQSLVDCSPCLSPLDQYIFQNVLQSYDHPASETGPLHPDAYILGLRSSGSRNLGLCIHITSRRPCVSLPHAEVTRYLYRVLSDEGLNSLGSSQCIFNLPIHLTRK